MAARKTAAGSTAGGGLRRRADLKEMAKMMNTETGRRQVLVRAVRRAVPVLAIAGLLAPVAAPPADAAGTSGARAAQLMRPAGPGLAAAVPAGFRPASASFLSPGSGFVLGG